MNFIHYNIILIYFTAPMLYSNNECRYKLECHKLDPLSRLTFALAFCSCPVTCCVKISQGMFSERMFIAVFQLSKCVLIVTYSVEIV